MSPHLPEAIEAYGNTVLDILFMEEISAVWRVCQGFSAGGKGAAMVEDAFEIQGGAEQGLLSATPAGIDSWMALEEAHRVFLAGGDLPESSGFLRREIRDSWVRCQRVGVDPAAKDLAEPITQEDFEYILDVYRDVIEVLTPLMSMVDSLGLENDYIFEFVARNGVSVLKSGKLNLHEVVYSRSIMSELTMGTNAHTLCMRHRMPMQVMGPEHYCEALHGLAGVACPVFDKRGTVIGSLLLTQPISSEPWSVSYQKLLSHAMALLVSIGVSLESQLVLRESLVALEDASGKLEEASLLGEETKHVLDVAVGSSDAPVLIVNASGIVQHASPDALVVLKKTVSGAVGKTIEAVLGLSWPDAFQPLLKGDRGLEIAARVGSHSYGVRGNPVCDAKTGALEGMVLRLFERQPGVRTAKRVGDTASVTFEDILGESEAMQMARTLAARFARTSENVLIVGESGTGKEYFAQAVHNESRPKGPFMSINCAAIPPRLIESELFGYEGGAFTGADKAGKPGKIELADGGTLFLDEIGDMPLELQATLLRVLENKRVMRIGGKAYKQVDCRIVAATNCNLPKLVGDGKFREDLLYRLSILTVELPPLRDREGDVAFFAQYFLNECRSKSHEGPTCFSPEAEALIEAFSWPGNVRQIKNVVYSAFYAATGPQICACDLPQYVREGRAIRFNGFSLEASEEDAIPDGPGSASAWKGVSRVPEVDGLAAARMRAEEAGCGFSQGAPQCASATERPTAQGTLPGSRGEGLVFPPEMLKLYEMERAAISLAMLHAEGSAAKAAELLGISKATLYRKLKEFGIDRGRK